MGITGEALLVSRPIEQGVQVLIGQKLAAKEARPYRAIQVAAGLITIRATTRAGFL
jgi:hypothetical protein